MRKPNCPWRLATVVGLVLPLPVVLASVLTLAGCTDLRQPAADLASSGSAAAKSLQTVVQQNCQGLQTYRENQFLLAALDPNFAGINEKQLRTIDEIEKLIELRDQTLNRLAAAYEALGKLAAYDASTEVQTAVTSLMTAVTEYEKALHSGSDETTTSEIIAGSVARTSGLLAGFLQSRKLQDASRSIHSEVERLASAMESEKKAYQALSTDMVAKHEALAAELFKRGIGKPNAIIKERANAFGLEYDDKQFGEFLKAEGNSDQFKRAVTKVIAQRASRSCSLQNQLLEESIDALKALGDKHDQLENGKPLNLDTLATCLTLITDCLTELKALKAKSKSE